MSFFMISVSNITGEVRDVDPGPDIGHDQSRLPEQAVDRACVYAGEVNTIWISPRILCTAIQKHWTRGTEREKRVCVNRTELDLSGQVRTWCQRTHPLQKIAR